MSVAKSFARPLATGSPDRGRPAGRRRYRIALVLAILTSIAAGGAIWSEAPVAYQGRLIDVDGNPVRATVVFTSGGKPAARAMTSPAGAWTVSGGHRFEDHRLLITAAGYLPLSLPAAPAGGTVSAVIHRLPELSGAVKDEVGQPVPGAEVVLVPEGRTEPAHSSTAADGGFRLAGSVLPGSYRLTVTAADHEPFETTAQLAADARVQITPTLARQLGGIELAPSPAGLQPLVDGKPLAGCQTPCSATLPVGDHTIRVETELYVPWEQKVQLANHQKVSLAPVLERKTGTLKVGVPAGGGELLVDGNPVAGAGFTGALPTGLHSVSFRADGFWPATANLNVKWNETAAIDLGSSLVPIKPGDDAAFLAGLDGYLKGFGGQYGVYIQDLTSGHELLYHQDDVMEAASDIKIPVALYLLHSVEQNKIKLDDRVALDEKDFMGGTGILNGAYHVGDTFSYGDLLALLIQQSDNTAWQALVRTFGADRVDAYAASLGAPDCHQMDDNCTAHEAGTLLGGLYRGKTLNAANTSLLMHLLETTVFNDRINYYLNGLLVAHKTGADGGVMNDVGIVFAPSGPVLISVFTVTDAGTVQPIRDVARAAIRYLSGH